MSARPLFVTRKFAPSVGGMETLSVTVWDVLSQAQPESKLIAYGGKNDVRLAVWMVTAVLRTAWLCLRGRVSVLLAGDALTHAVLTRVLPFVRVRRVTVVHGLDLTYSMGLYRWLVLPPVRTADLVLANSAATAAIARGVGVERVEVMRLSVPFPRVDLDRTEAGAAVRARWGLPEGAPLLLTLGRLVPRKGSRWFVENVLAQLPEEVHYLVAGTGPEEEPLRAAAARLGLADRVHLLGRVSEQEREQLLHGADLFVQPNVVVPGDMEGFGLVVVEASQRGLPVVGADLEGIKDAVVPGATGVLVASGDAPAWVAAVTDLLGSDLPALGRRFALAARDAYNEQATAATLLPAVGLP